MLILQSCLSCSRPARPALALLVLGIAVLRLDAAEFVKKATWEETEKANPCGVRTVVPEKWLYSPTTPVGDIRFWYCGGPPEDISTFYNQKKPANGWTFVEPDKNGVFLRRQADASGSKQGCVKEAMYTEYIAPADGWGIFSYGVKDGFRLDYNGKHMYYSKWRVGPFYPHNWQDVVRIRQGPNKIWFNMMRKGGTGKFQFVIRTVDSRIDFLHFLMTSFPDDLAHVGGAAEELLHHYRTFSFVRTNPLERQHIEKLYSYLRAKIESGKYNEQMLSVFTNFCIRYRFVEKGEMALIKKHLFSRKGLGPRLVVSTIAYSKFAGSDNAVPKCLEYLKKRRTVEETWARVFYETCLDFRMYDEGVATITVLTQRAKGDLKAFLTAWAGDLHDKKGDYESARKVYESIVDHEDKLQEALLVSPVRNVNELTVLIRSGSAMLHEAMGAREALGIVKNMAQAGKKEEAAQTLVAKIEELRDMVVPMGDELAMDSFAFFMKEVEAMPKDLQALVRKLFRWKAEETLASGFDRLDSLRRSWGMLQGKGMVNDLAVSEAGRLLDSGSAGLAKSWYKAAWLAEKKPQTAAELALAASASDDAVLLKYLQRNLTSAERQATIRLAGKPVKLGSYIDYLAKDVSSRPRETTVSLQSFSEGWLTELSLLPTIPCGYAKTKEGPRPTAPVPIAPCLHGDKLILFKGTALEAYNVKTGKRLWSTRTTGKRADKIRGNMELPLMVPAVHRNTGFFRVPVSVSTRGRWRTRQFKMCAVDLETGRILWSTDRTLSNPAVGQAMVYYSSTTETSTEPTVRATAVDPLSGKVVWHRVLATDMVMGRARSGVREVAPPLVTPDGVLFSTGLGVVAMLHPLTGDIIWLRRYPRPPHNELVGSYHVSPTQFTAGLVAITPRETHLAYGLDPKTGKTKWEASTSRAPYVAGVWNGKLVMVGEAIRLLDGGTGREVAKTHINPIYFPNTRIYGDKLLMCCMDAVVSYDLRTLKELPAPIDLQKEEIFAYPLGRYAVTVSEDTARVHGQSKTDFGQLASDRSFEKLMLAMKRGETLPDVSAATGPSPASGASPEDIATFRLLMASALAKAGQVEKAKAQAATLLRDSGDSGLLRVRRNHRLRPSQPAHRVLGDGGELGRAVTEPPVPEKARPMPMWVKEGDISGTSVPPSNRGVLLVWAGGQVEMINMRGFGETIWLRQLSHPVQRVIWYDDIVILRLNEGPLTALDLYTGDLLWTKAQSTEERSIPTLHFSQYDGGMLMWTRSGYVLSGVNPRTGRVLWRTEVPERRIPYKVSRAGDKLYMIASKMFDSERGGPTRGDWRVYEVDPAQKRVTRAVPIGSGATPSSIDGNFIIMSESDGSVASARDLQTGKRIWKDAFDMPVTARALVGPNGRKSLLGIIDKRTWEMKQVISPETGQVIADARHRELHFENGAPYAVDKKKRNLVKIMAASVTKKKQGAAVQEEEFDDADIIDDIGGDISADLGVKSSKSNKADAGLELIEWEYKLPTGRELAWHWQKDYLLTVETGVGVADFYKLDLKTGKPGRRFALAYPGAGAAGVRWMYDGRYCAVRTERGLYCFKMVDESGLRAFVNERRAAAGKVASVGDRAAAYRAARLGVQALQAGGTLFKPGPRSTLRLDKATQWVPGAVKAGTGWDGKDDLSASVKIQRRGRENLSFTIQVKDDYWEPYTRGSGDYLTIDIGGLAFSVGMTESGQAVCERRQPDPRRPPLPVHSVKSRMNSYDTVEYTFVVSGYDEPPVEGEPRKPKPGKRSYLNFRLAVLDSDGSGHEGQLEWGLGHGRLSLTP